MGEKASIEGVGKTRNGLGETWHSSTMQYGRCYSMLPQPQCDVQKRAVPLPDWTTHPYIEKKEKSA